MALADRRLFVIGQDDKVSRNLARTMSLLCSVDFKGLDSSIPTLSQRADAVVVRGMPLTETVTIGRVSRALQPFLDQHIPVLYLLDALTRRDQVQARAIGASAVLSSDTPLRQIADTVYDLVRVPAARSAAEQREALQEAVEEVTFSLSDILSAAETGRRIQIGLAQEAGTLLLQALDTSDVMRWMQAVRFVHDPIYRHSLMMAGVMGAFVLHLGFRSADCERMVSAALLHDVGKSLIPVEIMDKPGPLTTDEMETMHQHAVLGYNLLKTQGGHHALTLQISCSHHEYLDGSGYPYGLTAERIPDPVRIATLCDVFAALIEQRAYKVAMTPSKAFEYMDRMIDKLDPVLLTAFRKVFVRQ